MGTTQTVDGMQRRTGGLLYPVLVIAGVAATVFSAVGIATMLGLMPDALSMANQLPAPVVAAPQFVAVPQAESAVPAAPAAQIEGGRAGSSPR